MSKEIRIVKTSMKTAFRIGGYNDKWEPSDVLAKIPLTAQYIAIKDGYVGNIPYIEKETGKPVSAEELLKALLRDNRKTLSINAKGSHQKNQYGQRWFIDYEAELESIFKEYNIPIPEDRRTIFQKSKDFVVGSLVRQGLADPSELSAEANPVPPGQAALEQAKREKELNEIEEMKKQMAELIESNKKLQEEAKSFKKEEVKVEEEVKSTKKKDKELVKA